MTDVLQAFIPAAGTGSRLRPLTDTRPKALVNVGEETLLSITIKRLTAIGVRHIAVNVHHFASQIIDYINKRDWAAEIVISDETVQLMETGGGIKKAEAFFLPDTPIIIHNVDVVSNIDIEEMLRKHQREKDLVTLAVSKRESSRQLLFDEKEELIGWVNKREGTSLLRKEDVETSEHLSFSGISIAEPELLEMLPSADKPYPIIPEYIKLSNHHRISYYEHSPKDWMDVGTPERLTDLNTQETYENFFGRSSRNHC